MMMDGHDEMVNRLPRIRHPCFIRVLPTDRNYSRSWTTGEEAFPSVDLSRFRIVSVSL